MKRLVLGLVMIAASVCTNAQSTSLGINAGVGHSWLRHLESSSYPDVEYMPHGNVGFSLIHSTKTNFGFGADLKYSWEGGKVQNKATQSKREVSLQYVRVPLKAMYFFGKYGQRVRPKVFIGPSFGFLVDANEKATVNNVDYPTQDVKDYYDGLDIGAIIGAGINYRLVKNTWFTADLNYTPGLKDVRENSSTSSPKLFNNNIAVNVGVNWGIGK